MPSRSPTDGSPAPPTWESRRSATTREFLHLEDGTNRPSIRRVAADRLSQIEAKLADLKRMQGVLKELLTECEHTKADLPCPIIGTPRIGAPR